METANLDLHAWLLKKEERIHGTTHEVVSQRFDRERPLLMPLPPKAFDTSYRIYRKVYKDCTIRFEGNSYVVPHTLVGKQVILRVKSQKMRIFFDDRLVVTYEIPPGKGNLVQKKRFYDELQKDREMNKRKYGITRRTKGRAKHTISPLKPLYDLDVQIRPMDIYDEEVRI